MDNEAEEECTKSEFSQILEICSEDCHFKRLAFDKSYQRLIACSTLGNIYLFDLETDSFVSFTSVGQNCSAVSLNAGVALIGTTTGFVRCIDTGSGAITSERACFEHEKESSGPVADVDVKPGSEATLALACLNANVLIWDVPKLNPRFRLRGTTNILQAFYSDDGGSIVTCHLQTSVNVWDSVDLKPKTEIVLRDEQESSLKITTIAMNRDNTVIIAGSECGKIIAWDVKDLSMISEVCLSQAGNPDSAVRVAFVERDLVAVVVQSGKLHVVGVKKWQVCRTFKVSDAVCRAAFDHSCGNVCATIDTCDGRIRILKIPTLKKKGFDSVHVKNKPENGVISKNETAAENMKKHMDPEKLRKLVRHSGQFPEENRGVIWKYYLQIPNNKDAFKTLVQRGLHPAFKKRTKSNLYQGFDAANDVRFRTLLSTLAHWTPLLGEFAQLPTMAAPFFHVFQIKLRTCFEVFATVLTNWCASYFEFFPAPPVPILAELEQLIEKRDKSIVEHMESTGVTTQTYLWPMMSTLMAQVLPGDEWTRVWDHVIVHPINFLGYVVASYVVLSKQALLRLKDRDSIENYFRNPNAISIPGLLREAYKMYEQFPPVAFRIKVVELLPLTEGVYPMFVSFPKVSVDYRLHEKAKLQKDLDEWKRQHGVVDLLEADVGKLHEEEERWRVKEATMRIAENFRRKIMIEEEDKIAAQRTAVKQATRELRLKELEVLQMRSRGIRRDRMLDRELYMERMEDDIVRKSQLRDQELMNALEDAEMRNFKHQSELLRLNTELAIGNEAFRDNLKQNFDHVTAANVNSAQDMINGSEVEVVNGDHIMSVSEINEMRRRIARSKKCD